MAFNSKIYIDDRHVIQEAGQQLTLSGDTVIADGGNISYATAPTLTGDTQLATKQYVDIQVISGVTGGTIYNLASPSTVEVGGLPASSQLTGFNSNELLEKILVKYLLPTFNSFSSEMNTPVEVGCVLTGNKSFNWGFTNPTNITAASMCIVDVTSSVTIATDISISSPQSADIGTKTFTTCGQTQRWCGNAKNTCGTQFGSSSQTITGLYPYYWGKCTCPGAAGASRPTPNTDFDATNITGGTKVLATSAGSFAINFNTTDDDYLWFAVPASVADKSAWFVDTINSGTIGGGVGAGCNLFPDPVIVANVANACWSGVNYEVYVSNKQTAQTLSMTIS